MNPPASILVATDFSPPAEHALDYACTLASKLDANAIEHVVRQLATDRSRGGRVFFLGVGGSAANASHAVNDFRKLTGIECYAPTDNVSELTARTNHEGWPTVFAAWLETSRLNEKDAVFIFSVGGGDAEKNISPNLVHAIDLAKSRGAAVLGLHHVELRGCQGAPQCVPHRLGIIDHQNPRHGYSPSILSMQTRFLPLCLAMYKYLSALWIRDSSVSPLWQ